MLSDHTQAMGNKQYCPAASSHFVHLPKALLLEVRIAHRKYPETLEQLVPAYLDRIPNDIVRGRPMIYQPAHGRYILRGVGPNGTDDRNTKNPTGTRPVSDDWLWSYGTNAPTTMK